MVKYIVIRKEIHEQFVELEADTPEEAKTKVQNGEGANASGRMYYLDASAWDVSTVYPIW